MKIRTLLGGKPASLQGAALSDAVLRWLTWHGDEAEGLEALRALLPIADRAIVRLRQKEQQANQ